MPIKWYKKVWFCLTFPLFDQIGKFSTIIALFKRVEWKPIPHNAAVSIDEINQKSKIINEKNEEIASKTEETEDLKV